MFFIDSIQGKNHTYAFYRGFYVLKVNTPDKINTLAKYNKSQYNQ